MEISKELLIHLNHSGLERKSYAEMVDLCDKLLNHVRHLEERLSKNSSNSSIAPSTFIPGQASNESKFQEEVLENKENGNKVIKDRKQRDQGYGRTEQLAVTATRNLYPEKCGHCSVTFGDEEQTNSACFTAFYQLDLKCSEKALGGYVATNTKINLFSITCLHCNQLTRYAPLESATIEEKVTVKQWQLISPTLASVITYLKYDIGSTIRKIQRLLFDMFRIKLSVGVICKSLHKTGLSAEPITEQLKETLGKTDLLHADETGWKESKKSLWLWVCITVNTCLFIVGGRTKKMAQILLQENKFFGWLMSDGYLAYRHYQKRFRCWAHLIRKVKGIKETTWIDGINFGSLLLGYFDTFKSAIYASRENNQTDQSLKERFKDELETFQKQCVHYSTSSHKATKALAKEFLNDWNCIFQILDYASYSLTNNEAERALRHWVIIRKLTQGTRTPIGSKSLSILASIIATCRLRTVNTIDFIKDVVVSARSGSPLPVLPESGV